MKRNLLLILLVTAAAALSSCKSQYELLLNSNDVDGKYAAAFDYFNQEKYSKAANLFESLSVQTTGTERDDTVRYYWGLSNYKFKDYYTAETNFDSFLETFPNSPFSPEARFLRLDCLFRSTLRYELDQLPTRKAIQAINEYLKEFPETEHADVCDEMLTDLGNRLDTKAYESARLYYKMEDYIASRVALKNVLKDNSDNIYREDILYYIAMSSFKYAQFSMANKQRERFLTFVDDYLNFKSEYADSKYAKELAVLNKRAQKFLGGSSAGLKDAHDDKIFIKERRKTERDLRKSEKESAKKEKSAAAGEKK